MKTKTQDLKNPTNKQSVESIQQKVSERVIVCNLIDYHKDEIRKSEEHIEEINRDIDRKLIDLKYSN